jgi:hypothetical protein
MSSEKALEKAGPEPIRRLIHEVRGQNVMLDSDLATLYGVETGALVRAMKRSPDRFPDDFAFQLDAEEWGSLRCQIGISNEGRGGRRYLPYVFTEQGVAMLSSVLRSQRAAAVNVAIMRAFVAMRRELAAHAELSHRLDELERTVRELGAASDEKFARVYAALRAILSEPRPKRKPIGFTAELGKESEGAAS